MKARHVATAFFLVAATLHLSVFGILPYGWKPAGDAILVGLLSAALIRRTPTLRRRSPAPRITVVAIGAISIYAVWLTFVSIVRIDDLMLVLQWARRWLVLALYAVTVFCCRDLLDRRLLKIGLVGMSLTATAVMFATDLYGISWPNVVESLEFQGGVIIKKISVPGAFLIVIMTLYAWAKALERVSVAAVIRLLTWTAIFLLTIRFRGWWIASGIAFFVIPIMEPMFALKPRLLLRNVGMLIAVTVAISTVASLTPRFRDEMDTRLEWLRSAVQELEDGSGNVGYRMERDVARIDISGTKTVSRSWFGYGFIPSGSTANVQLGITSETNDSGWIEVLLTGGYVAAVLLTALVASIVFHIWQTRSTPALKAAASAGWLVAVTTMFSSNLLLWDFGFVPLMLWYALAVSEPQQPIRSIVPSSTAVASKGRAHTFELAVRV